MHAIPASLTNISNGFKYSSLSALYQGSFHCIYIFPAFPRRKCYLLICRGSFGHTITGRSFCTPFVISQARVPLQYRVFKVFKISAARRIPVEIHSRSKPDIYLLFFTSLPTASPNICHIFLSKEHAMSISVGQAIPPIPAGPSL